MTEYRLSVVTELLNLMGIISLQPYSWFPIISFDMVLVEESKLFGNWAKWNVSPPHARKIMLTAVSFLLACSVSRGLVFGKYSRFLVWLSRASVPKGRAFGARFTSVYRLLNPFSGLCTGSICSGAGCGGGYSLVPFRAENVNTHPLFTHLWLLFCRCCSTGMTMVFLNGSITYSAALYVAESFFGSRVRLLFEPHFQSAAGFPP